MKRILIVIAILMLSVPVFADNTVKTEPLPEICFSIEDGKAILKDLEGYDACMEAIGACELEREAEAKHAAALEDRVKEQDGEIARAERIIEDTRKAGEQAAKGSWWARFKNYAGAMGVGSALTLVAIAILAL